MKGGRGEQRWHPRGRQLAVAQRTAPPQPAELGVPCQVTERRLGTPSIVFSVTE